MVPTVEVPSGRIVGSTTWTINHAKGLDARSGTWSNFTSFYLEARSGDAANIVSNTVTCQGTCSVRSGDPLGGSRSVALNASVSGRTNLAANPPAGSIINNLNVAWTEGFKTPTGPFGYATIISPNKVRCDAQTNTGAAQGCVHPDYTPFLELRTYGSGNHSVALIYWFQSVNVDRWGQYPNGKPLTRLNNPTQANRNRAAMCQSGAWVANPVVPNDSCDEFPFASSYQSGNMLGLNASQCAQARFEFNPATGGWTVYPYAGYSSAQRCVLGHIPLSDNESVGGSYGSFIQNSRVLDRDPFWIYVS